MLCDIENEIKFKYIYFVMPGVSTHRVLHRQHIPPRVLI
jgi:hypothetical protein